MSAQLESDWEAIVIGAGISGLVSASVLHRQGLERILVIDEYDQLGGNHIHCHIGPYTFDIGSLIFQDTSALIEHFPELLPLYHPVSVDLGRIVSDGSQRPYPFSFRDEVVAAGPVELMRVAASLALARIWPSRITNAEEYARYWLGNRIYEKSGLQYYIERFHGARPTEIDSLFAEKRMTAIAQSASIRNRFCSLLTRKRPSRPHREFVRPREGFDKLYGAVAKALELKGTTFALGTALQAVERKGSKLRVRGRGFGASSSRVIATIPLTMTLRLCGLPDPGALPTVTLVSLFASFNGRRGFSPNILYNFSRTGQWKRITLYSDFYGREAGREYFTVEVNHTATGPVTHEMIRAIYDRFRKDVRDKGLFDGDMLLEGSHILENGYPIYRKGAAEVAFTAIASLREFGIESFGRQGGFDYLPSAHVVTPVVEQKLGYHR